MAAKKLWETEGVHALNHLSTLDGIVAQLSLFFYIYMYTTT